MPPDRRENGKPGMLKRCREGTRLFPIEESPRIEHKEGGS